MKGVLWLNLSHLWEWLAKQAAQPDQGYGFPNLVHHTLQVHLQSHAVVDNVEEYLSQVSLGGGLTGGPTHSQRKLLRQMLRCSEAERTPDMLAALPPVSLLFFCLYKGNGQGARDYDVAQQPQPPPQQQQYCRLNMDCVKKVILLPSFTLVTWVAT